MRPAAEIDELLRDPNGLYITGEAFLYACPMPELFVLAFWGQPRESDMQRLVRALRVELEPGVVPHASLVDTRRVERVDASAFAVLSRYVQEQSEPLRQQVRRLALLRPEGLVGAVATGFYAMMSPAPYPVEVFSELGPALRWLGVEHAEAIVGSLDELCDRVRGMSPMLRRLRELLDARPGQMSLESAARLLAQSPRTLQRRLHDEATTFQLEQSRAQLRAAERLMLESDEKLASIARDVGCASLQHFSALFRRATGESPSAWRKRHRGE